MTKQELNIRVDELSWVIKICSKKNISQKEILGMMFARFDHLIDLKSKEKEDD